MMGCSHLSSSSSPMSSLLSQATETLFDDEVAAVLAGPENIAGGGGSDEDEYVQMLLTRETQLGPERNDPLVDSIEQARSEFITWVLKTRVVLGFRIQTTYLSLTYFDRFIQRRSIDIEKPWAVRLLSMACLSLAAKMEELKVPELCEFQIGEFGFESRVVQRMELLVLSTLQWRMDSITPFDFMGYFIRKLHKEPKPDTVSKIVELFVLTMREIRLMQYRPSVIALAATLVALDHRLTRSGLEIRVINLASREFIELDHVLSCYNLLQLQTHLRPHEGVESPSANSSTSKRKRLSFNGCDHNHDLPKEKRLC